MALSHSPKIITDGLVLALDAANPRSYPGSGTVWKDLSGLGNNGTLVNGVGYSADDKGTMVFDGVNDYAEVLNPFYQYSNEITVSAFCKFNTFEYILSQSTKNIDSMTTNVWLWHKGTNGLIWYINDSGSWKSVSYLNSLFSGEWYHITTTASSSNIKIYINATNVTSGAGISLGILNNSLSGIATNDYRYSSSRTPINGSISNIIIYNRALSNQEISQNFEALRGRYGI